MGLQHVLNILPLWAVSAALAWGTARSLLGSRVESRGLWLGVALSLPVTAVLAVYPRPIRWNCFDEFTSPPRAFLAAGPLMISALLLGLIARPRWISIWRLASGLAAAILLLAALLLLVWVLLIGRFLC
ncbi:hypothetical protein QOL99_14580 [Deinococcus sp. MIMF12]|uniref:Uncharacterized protein n=1 Tax=Deinococcus rhizophilus TaxID=3049544 RepID=A0ABT7JLL5_9DEIO|nr:hypothetical protein [Deinococcus rhizophilus]MDL2345365.1 hypothetical protein [Deinococcus rhizophilus]